MLSFLSKEGESDTERDGITLSQEEERDCGKCVERGNKSIMVLSSRDADAPNCPMKWKLKSPIGKAVQNRDMAMVKHYASENPKSLSRKDVYGRTPFHYACWYGADDIVLFLTKVLTIAEWFLTDNQGWSALHFACDASFPCTKIVNHLVYKLNMDPRQGTKKGSTPVSLAAYKGHAHIVKILTDIMLRLNPTDPSDQLPFLVIPGQNRLDSLESSDHPNGDRNMTRVENRLFTFTMGTATWPRVRPTGRLLAQQGFVYTGLDERVFCFCCKAVIDSWDDGEDPLLKHYRKSSKCQFLQNNFGFELEQLLAKSKIKHMHPEYTNNASRLHSFRTWRFSDIVSYFKLASAGFFFTGKDMRTQCFSCGLIYDRWRKEDIPMEVHRRWNPNCEFLLSLAAMPSLPVSKPMTPVPKPLTPVSLHEQQMIPPSRMHTKQPDYECVENRIKSFKLLPKEVPVSAENCSKAGLFFLRKPDVMQCFKCDAIVRGWVMGDIPSEKHRAISPQCKFLRDHFPTKLDNHQDSFSFDPSSLPEPKFTQDDLELMSKKESSLPDLSSLSFQPESYSSRPSTYDVPSPQDSESSVSSYSSRKQTSSHKVKAKNDSLPETQLSSLDVPSTSHHLEQPKQKKLVSLIIT